MLNQLRPALVVFALLAILTGVFYPLAVTGMVQAFFPTQANGSLIERDGKLLGSTLIGQNFSDPKYFWGRPSTTVSSPYTAFNPATMTGSSGSNLGPLSRSLVDAVRVRTETLRLADPSNTYPIPVDLVTASASGLDPHISLAAANHQVPRVARARGMSEADVFTLIDQNAEGHQLGFLDTPRVNVLLLNLALDGIQ